MSRGNVQSRRVRGISDASDAKVLIAALALFVATLATLVVYAAAPV